MDNKKQQHGKLTPADVHTIRSIFYETDGYYNKLYIINSFPGIDLTPPTQPRITFTYSKADDDKPDYLHDWETRSYADGWEDEYQHEVIRDDDGGWESDGTYF